MNNSHIDLTCMCHTSLYSCDVEYALGVWKATLICFKYAVIQGGETGKAVGDLCSMVAKCGMEGNYAAGGRMDTAGENG